MGLLRIRLATRQHELHDAYELRKRTEAWLHARGIDQWTNTQTGFAQIKSSFDEGALRLVEDDYDAALVGVFALNGPDPDFWTEQEMDEPAVYLYKLMITDEWRGTGLGDQLLDHACERAEAAGANWVRLDCWKTNEGLQRYYTERGFSWVDTRTAPGRNSGWLAQRPATEIVRSDQHHMLIDDTPEPTPQQQHA